MRLYYCFFFCFSVLGSCEKCDYLHEVNNPEVVQIPFELGELPNCNNSRNVRKNITFRIDHELDCDLSSFRTSIFVDYTCVYFGAESDEITLTLAVCPTQAYEIKIAIVDTLNNLTYWWQNKNAYRLVNYDDLRCTLLSADHFNNSDGVEYKIVLN